MTVVLEPTPAAADRPVLVRGVSVLHLPQCPHVARFTELQAATEDDLATFDVCNWSRAELDGYGRSNYATIEEAMDAFGSSTEAKRIVRAEIGSVEFDDIWIPYSRSYIALGRNGLAVGWILRTIIELHGQVIQLPDYSQRFRTTVGDSERHGTTCPSCFLEMPLSGVCDSCD